MSRIYDGLLEHLNQCEFRYERDDDRETVRFALTGKNGQYQVHIVTRENTDRILIYTIVPLRISEEQRPGCAELIARANYGLQIGNFELDMDDGEVRYKTSADFEGLEEIPLSLFRPLLGANIATMDRYFPALCAYQFGGKTPEEAVRMVEEQNE